MPRFAKRVVCSLLTLASVSPTAWSRPPIPAPTASPSATDHLVGSDSDQAALRTGGITLARGRRTVNTDPRPGALSSSIVPPSWCT